VQILAALLEVLGAVSLTAAAWTVAPGLGLAVAGVALVIFGLALERQ
jgi:hypothetical protein